MRQLPVRHDFPTKGGDRKLVSDRAIRMFDGDST